MSLRQQTTDETIAKCENWCRLAICINTPVKKALLAILHNTVSDPSINGLPEDPILLYKHMITNEKKLRKSKCLKQDQLDQLLPHKGEVFSDSLDVTLIRFLIQTFSNIVNEDGNWKKPRHNDHSIAAAVFRAADIRNRIFHFKDPNALGNVEFEKMWREIKDILADLRYAEDISNLKINSLDPDTTKRLKQILSSNMAEDFEKILLAYKKKCIDEENDELKTFVQRRFRDKTTKNIILDFNTLINNHDLVMVSAEAGLGKTFSAKHLRYLWACDKMFPARSLLFINSKRVNKYFYKPSNASVICVSDLGDMLNDKTDEYLALFECVTKPIKDLVIIIDGVDELPIKENLDSDFLKKLQVKIDKNENISAIDTVMGVYFGMFFPGSKIIAFGRKNEIERLEEMQNQLQKSSLSDKKSQTVLELQALEEEDIKELISGVNCDVESCGCKKCTDTYAFVQDVEFRNIPSHLMALLRIFEYLPNPNFGRITKTKIFIITIFNLLKNHTQTVFLKDVKTFKELLKYDKAKEFRDCIQNIAKISFFSLLDKNVRIEVKAINKNDVEYFEYKQTLRDICVQIKRNILEQLDFFYIRDLEYDNFILEPYHLTNMEFLASCHIYCYPDERDLLLYPTRDRLTVILPYVAGLYSNDNFTQDFVCEVFPNTSDRDVETFLNWLFSVGNDRDRLPLCRWYGLKENGQLIPSLDLLDKINEEVDVFKNISEKLKDVQTLVCYCPSDFEWYNMEMFKHKFLTNDENKYNVKSFMSKYKNFQLIVKGSIDITNNEQFNLVLEMFNNDKIEFRIDNLYFNYNTPHSTHETKHLKCNSLRIGSDCDSSTIDFLLYASSLSTATTSSWIPSIKYKQLFIYNISHFNDQQIDKLVSLGLSDVVDSIALRSTFFADGQIAILEGVERKTNKKINIELMGVEFSDMFGLPNLGNRHVSLFNVNNVTDDNVTRFREHISPKHTNNLSYYKINYPQEPFVRKDNYSGGVEQSMFLNLFNVDFKDVSPEVFAETFSMISSLSCEDDDNYITSSHWMRLSQADDCRINEMRIWRPKPENFEYFLTLKTNSLQLICDLKSRFIQLLTHIVNNTNIELNKEIKIFVVKRHLFYWDNYEEITLFSGKTIEEFKNNNSSYDKRLDDFCDTFHEGEPDTLWCCEISRSAEKNTVYKDLEGLQGFSENIGSSVEETVSEKNTKISWVLLGTGLALGLVWLFRRR